MLKYSVLINYDTKDAIYVATVHELPGCMAHGKTYKKALKEIKIAMKLWLETANGFAHLRGIQKGNQ